MSPPSKLVTATIGKGHPQPVVNEAEQEVNLDSGVVE